MRPSSIKNTPIMKTDLYTKSILTIIAICLIILIARDYNLITPANANRNLANIPQYDQIVDVRIVGTGNYTEIPVKIANNNTPLPVKIQGVDFSIMNALPVKIAN